MDDTVNGLATVITAEMDVSPGFARALAVRLLTVLLANGWKPPTSTKS